MSALLRGCLKNFLRGMETSLPEAWSGIGFVLKNFLRGMETELEGPTAPMRQVPQKLP